MQSFTYKGQKYSFSDGTSNEDALVKIKTHLGESEEKTTSVGEDLATGFAGVGNLADTGLSMAASALARPFIGQEADNIFKDLNTRIEERNKWANPEGKKQTTGGKLISAIPGALGIPLAGLNIAGTGKEMLDAGESLPKSLAAGAGDAALQFATMGIPMPGKGVVAKAASTGAFNAGQNFLTDLGIVTLADTEAIKKARDPFDLDKALVSGVSGAVAGGAFHKYETNSARKLKEAEAKFDAGLKAALDAKKIVPPVEKVPTQMELPLEVTAQQIAERRGAEVGQPDLFGPQNIPKAELDGLPIADQLAMRRAIERDALLKAQQESLPLASSPEQIAEMQNRNSPQADMFGIPKDTTPEGMQARQEQKQLSAYERAQQQLAERQAALEFEVRRQAALDNGAAERARQEQAPTGFNDWQVGRAADEAAQTHDFLSRAQQAEIDATPHGDRPAQFGMTDTGGRLDENGIPIRADLSMEAQNLQDPLQRNLWGDELPRKSEQEAPLGLTEAIDTMPSPPWKGSERDNALAQLQNGISVPKGQRGAIDTKAFERGFPEFAESKVKDPSGKLIPLYHAGVAHSGLPTEGTGLMGMGAYFTSLPYRTESYAKLSQIKTGKPSATYQVYLNLKNPYDGKDFFERFGNRIRTPEQNKAITDRLKSEGYDGIIDWREKHKGGPDVWEAVRSAEPPAATLGKFSEAAALSRCVTARASALVPI